MNDTERAQWIDKDEGLYVWWEYHQPYLSKREFIRRYRKELTIIINRTLTGQRRTHAPITELPSPR